MKPRLLMIYLFFSLISFSCFAPRVCPECIEFCKDAFISVNNNSVILDYTADSTYSSGFIIKLKNAFGYNCEDIVIIPRESYGFIKAGTKFLPAPYDDCAQYTCVKKGDNLFLSGAPSYNEGFRPWVDKFDIVIGSRAFNVTVNFPKSSNPQLFQRGTQSEMNLDETFPGCGVGTVLQSVYDCSKKITNYAVYISPANTKSSSKVTNSDGTSDYYTLFTNPILQNPDLFWFVVRCPSGAGGTVPTQNCTSLTPVVPDNNPALDRFGPGQHPTFTQDFLKGYQRRILISGRISNNGNLFSFSQTNGFDPTLTREFYDKFADNNPGVIPFHKKAEQLAPGVCDATAGEALLEGSFSDADYNIRELISANLGNKITWQNPSYAMLIFLTGGTSVNGHSTCPVDGPANLPGFSGHTCCAMSNITEANNEGVNAINVPWLLDSTISYIFCNTPGKCTDALWSSSTYLPNEGWAFLPNVDSVTRAGYVENVFASGDFRSFYGARCFSFTWC